jgi:hypothetical protein
MKRTIVVAGITGLLLACSSTTSSGGGTTLASAPADLSDAVCTKVDSCTPGAISMLYGNLAACKERTALSLRKDLNAPGVGVTGSQLGDCVAAYKSLTCDDLSGESAQPKACDFRGTIANGAACGTDLQCASGSCYKGEALGCGTCKARAALGGDCSAASCENALFCSAGKCTAYAKRGAACSNAADGGARCEGRSTCVAGKCAAPLAENADCDLKSGSGGCDSVAFLQCVPTGAPDTTAGKCTKLTLAATGEPCGLISDKYVACGGATYCKGGSGATPGKCAARPKESEDCTDSRTCLPPASCNSTTKKCEIVDPATCK